MGFNVFRLKVSEDQKTFYPNLLIGLIIMIFQNVESFVDFLGEIVLIIQHPEKLHVVLFQ